MTYFALQLQGTKHFKGPCLPRHAHPLVGCWAVCKGSELPFGDGHGALCDVADLSRVCCMSFTFCIGVAQGVCSTMCIQRVWGVCQLSVQTGPWKGLPKTPKSDGLLKRCQPQFVKRASQIWSAGPCTQWSRFLVETILNTGGLRMSGAWLCAARNQSF